MEAPEPVAPHGDKKPEELEFRHLLKKIRKVNYSLIWMAAISVRAFELWVGVEKLPRNVEKEISQARWNFFMWLFSSYFFTHVPLGYFPLIIMNCFISLDNQVTPETLEFRRKVSEERNTTHCWTSPGITEDSSPEGPSLNGAALIALLYIGGICGLNMIYKTVDLNRYGRMVLGSTYVGAISAVFIVLGSFALKVFPGFLEIHKGLCEIWMGGAICLTGFLLMFIITNNINAFRGNNVTPRRLRLIRLDYESHIFLWMFCSMICYLPGTHKDLVVVGAMERYGGIVLETAMMNLKSLWKFGEMMIGQTFGVM